jgi:hypothetical protein
MSDNLFDLSDEELEAKFREAAAERDAAPEVEEPIVEDSSIEESSTEEFESLDESEETLEYDEEQPEDDQDSEHNTSTDEEEVDTEEEQSEESEDDTPDEGSEAEEEETTEDVEAGAEEVQPPQVMKFRADGREFEFTEDEMKEQFPTIFGQAMNYTKKMQAIKPYRKMIDAITQESITQEDLNLLIDVKKGDKDAIAEVLKRTGIDTLDLDLEESRYEAKDYGRDDSALAIKDVVDEISKDEEYATTQTILGEEWDDRSWQEMSSSPEMIKLLHVDVKSGMYDTIAPIAAKLKVYDNGRQSDLDYYKAAAQQHFAGIEQQQYEQQQHEAMMQQQKAEKEAMAAEQAKLEQARQQQNKRSATKKASSKRKAAAPSTSAVGKPDVVDYLDASEEAFEEWYRRTMDA